MKMLPVICGTSCKVTAEEEYAVISIQEHKSILQALELHDGNIGTPACANTLSAQWSNMLTRYVGDPSARSFACVSIAGASTTPSILLITSSKRFNQ